MLIDKLEEVTFNDIVMEDEAPGKKIGHDGRKFFRRKVNQIARNLRRKYLTLPNRYATISMDDYKLSFSVDFGILHEKSGITTKILEARMEGSLDFEAPPSEKELKKQGLKNYASAAGVVYLEKRVLIFNGTIRAAGSDTEIAYKENYLDNIKQFVNVAFANMLVSGMISSADKYSAALDFVDIAKPVAKLPRLPKMDGKESARLKYIARSFERRLRAEARPFFNNVAFDFSLNDPRFTLTLFTSPEYVGYRKIDTLKSPQPVEYHGTLEIQAGRRGSQNHIWLQIPGNDGSLFEYDISKPETVSDLFTDLSGIDKLKTPQFIEDNKIKPAYPGKKTNERRIERRKQRAASRRIAIQSKRLTKTAKKNDAPLTHP